MSRKLPPCDHDECPPSHCKRPGSLDASAGSPPFQDRQKVDAKRYDATNPPWRRMGICTVIGQRRARCESPISSFRRRGGWSRCRRRLLGRACGGPIFRTCRRPSSTGWRHTGRDVQTVWRERRRPASPLRRPASSSATGERIAGSGGGIQGVRPTVRIVRGSHP